MHYEILPLGSIEANAVVLWNEDAAPDALAPCWIVDPGGDAARLIAFLEKRRLEPVLVALTHAHFDHIGAVPELLARWPALKVHLGPGDEPMVDHPQNAWPPYYPGIARPAALAPDLAEGVLLEAGGLAARILATPGHTPGGVAFHFEAEKLLLTGDTLFAGSCGRTDFPGGSMPQLKASLARLAALAGDTVVVPGHGETTTIAREVASNPFLR